MPDPRITEIADRLTATLRAAWSYPDGTPVIANDTREHRCRFCARVFVPGEAHGEGLCGEGT